MSISTQLSRFWLWVDGVGAYLVCPGDEVIIGSPAGGATVDIPLSGDLSRRHARIVRQDETYLFEAERSATIDGQPVNGKMVLPARATIELGPGVLLRFVRPHPLSQSARLEFLSSHRTQPHADSVILLADTMVLGPAVRGHVVCPQWPGEVILTRDDDRLFAGATAGVSIDGGPTMRRGPLTSQSQVQGPGFAFSLEAR
jgi:hypothetical protein